MSEPTAEIVKARHSGKMFNAMFPTDLNMAAQLVIADLKLYTGLKVPTGDSFGRLAQFLAEALLSDYPYFTVPLIQLAIKKHAHVLTVGENKSFGRDISIADVHQILDAYSNELVLANEEVDRIFVAQAEEKILSEQEKQNIIRAGIEEKYQKDDLNDMTFVEHDQMVEDGVLVPLWKHDFVWGGLLKLKSKYKLLIDAVPVSSSDAKSIASIIHKGKYHDKLALMTELEESIKGLVASVILKERKQKGQPNIYKKED